MHRIAFGIATLLGIAIASPVFAANENVITQSKALAGNVTPGDTPGFPITINTPGAYVLGSGIDVPSGAWGIVVNANGVDIDMSGYTLSGNGNGDYGVVSGAMNGRIHDGIIATFKASGMYIRGNSWTVERMRIQRNSGMGIDATSSRYLSVLSSEITSNATFGILTGDTANIRDNTLSRQSSNVAIFCKESCHIEGNLVDENNYNGIETYSGMIIGNTVSRNQGYGAIDQSAAADTGFAHNTFINNISPGPGQTLNLVPINPNVCIGKLCAAP